MKIFPQPYSKMTWLLSVYRRNEKQRQRIVPLSLTSSTFICCFQVCHAFVENENKENSIKHPHTRVIHGDQGVSICDACCKGDKCNSADCFQLKQSKWKIKTFTLLLLILLLHTNGQVKKNRFTWFSIW